MIGGSGGALVLNVAYDRHCAVHTACAMMTSVDAGEHTAPPPGLESTDGHLDTHKKARATVADRSDHAARAHA
eukprot:1195207-Prorocentrum_minimum.AAC.3